MTKILFFPHSFVLLILILIAFPVLAALQPISDAEVASRTETNCHFNQDNSRHCTTTYRYTILTSKARESLSRIDYTYPENDSVVIEKAEVIQPGSKVPDTNVQIDTRMAPNPNQGFLHQKQISIAFPNLRVGSTITYTLKQHAASYPFGTQFHEILEFSPQTLRHDYYTMVFTSERPMVWRAQNMDAFQIQVAKDGKKIIVQPKSLPYYFNYINEPNNGYLRFLPRLEIGSSMHMADYFAPFSARYTDIISAALPLGVKRIVEPLKSQAPEQIVSTIMEYLYEHYRYLGDWRASERGFIPFTLQEIEHRGYGDCKDLAVLLVAMLRQAGLNAELAFVSRGVVAPALMIPGLAAPNHVIVRAVVRGSVWWLDPTNTIFIPGYPLPDIQERWALVMNRQGEMREEVIPVAQPTSASTVRTHIRFLEDGKAIIKAMVTLNGLSSGNIRLMDVQEGQASSDKILCENFADMHQDCVLQRAKSQFVIPKTYTIAAKLTNLKALKKVDDDYLYSPLKLFIHHWVSLAHYREQGQLTDLYLGEPKYTVRETFLSGGKIKGPVRNCTLHSPWIDINFTSEPTSQGYHYLYKETIKTSWLHHEYLISPEFDTLLEQANNCIENFHLRVQFS